MIAISVLLFRKRIRNVYEYVLIGAAVGAGFTIFEEFLYGGVSSPLSMIFRLLLIAIHMMLNMIMGYYIGKARYQRVTGTGGAFWSYVLAFIIPIALHTIHDATTGMNAYLQSDDSALEDTGIIIGIVGSAIFFALQFYVFRQFKKKAKKLSMMMVLPPENTTADTDTADTEDEAVSADAEAIEEAADTTDAPETESTVDALETADAADTSNNA